MKPRLLIIILAIIVMILSVTVTYVSHQMNVCKEDPAFMHNPQMNGIWDCLEYLSNSDPTLPDLKPSIDYDARFIDIVILEIILIASITSGILIFVTRRKRNVSA